MSLVTQVVLRKDDKLYINDGIYGSFDELTLPGWTADYPRARVLRSDAEGPRARSCAARRRRSASTARPAIRSMCCRAR